MPNKIFRVNQSSQDLIKNVKALHAFEITDFFNFTLPVKEKFFINHIDLFFKVEGPQEGSFGIILLINKKSTRFVIPRSSLVNDTPLRLVLEDHPYIESPIDVYIKLEEKQAPLSIWLSESGPCVVMNGDPMREIKLRYTPVISILMPLFDSSIEYLTQAVASVQNQIYSKWELCLSDDGSTKRDHLRYIRSLNDPRIKLKTYKNHRGIAAATNKALEIATGEYACFLDHDDVLAPEALLEVAAAVDCNRDLKFIYSDEDKILEDGSFVDSFFKPDWSYVMLLSQNYICHLATIQTQLLRDVGGMREGYEGSQDYDLFLRCSEKLTEKEIAHIPRVLYHWRKHKNSTSADITVKPGAHCSALQALRSHLDRVGEHGANVTVGRYLGTYHVDYPVGGMFLVNIIIPTRDNPVYLKTCIFSIQQATKLDHIITIVDNGSVRPETLELLDRYRKIENIKVLRYDAPFNFSAINNFAVREGKFTSYRLFMNDDTEVISLDWIEQLVQHMQRNNTEVVGPKLLYSDNRIQHAGVIIGIGGVAGHSHKHMPDGVPGYFSRPHLVQNVSAVTGACMLVSNTVFKEVGGFEEDLPKAFNDIDFCLKVRKAGYNIVYNPFACLFHHESVSRGLDNHKDKGFAKAVEYMQKKWGCGDFKDPYYNPNLTLVDENFSFRVAT